MSNEILKSDKKLLVTIRMYDKHKKLLKRNFNSVQSAIDHFIEKVEKKEKNKPK